MRVKDCRENLDVILALEGDELIIEDKHDLRKVFGVCYELKNSQRILFKTY